MEMVGAGRVDDDPVRRIGRDDRRDPKEPDRKPLQRLGVGGRARHHGARSGPGPAPAPSSRACRRAGQPLGLPRRRRAPRACFRPGRPEPAARQPEALRRRPSVEAGRWARSAGRARRPVPSHASSSKSALSPARARISSTSQRCRPTPGTGSGAEGSTEMRQRVVAAVGCPKSIASVWRRHRRSAMPMGPCLPRQAEAAGRPSSRAAQPRPRPRQAHRAEAPPPCRRARFCRRRPRHR